MSLAQRSTDWFVPSLPRLEFVPTEKFNRWIGPQAALVLTKLAFCGAGSGESFPTIAWMSRGLPTHPDGAARFDPQTPHQTRWALRKLARLGLIVNVGKRLRDVRDRRAGLGGRTIRQVYARRVLVHHAAGQRGLPQEVMRRMANHKERRGGTRVGAGRKGKHAHLDWALLRAWRQALGLTQAQGAQLLGLSGHTIKRCERAGSGIKTALVAGVTPMNALKERNQNRAADIVYIGLKKNSKNAPRSAADCVPFLGRATEVGLTVGGSRPTPPVATIRTTATLKQTSAPPYPGMRVLPPVFVPRAPLLDTTLTQPEQVERLLKAYRGCHERRFKKRCWLLARKGQAEKSRHWKRLVAFSKLCGDKQIRPAAWVAFMFDRWVGMGNDGPPPLRFVFSTSFAEDHGHWYEHEADGYCGSMSLMSKETKDVYSRWQAMSAAIDTTLPQTASALEAVVEAFFPDDDWRQDVLRARRADQELQQRLSFRFNAGEYLWAR